jgi:hypothetical protein
MKEKKERKCIRQRVRKEAHLFYLAFRTFKRSLIRFCHKPDYL